MNPIIAREVARALIADWERQDERNRMTARLTRKEQARHLAPRRRVTAVARRVLAVLGTCSLRPPPSQSGQEPKATS